MKKQIEISLQKARELFGQNDAMDKLLLENFKKEELIDNILPNSIRNVFPIDGFVISLNGEVEKAFRNTKENHHLTTIFKTEKQAKSALAMAQLSQLMHIYNDGWEADWNNTDQAKYVIDCTNNKIDPDMYLDSNTFLSFKTEEIRDLFLKNFEPLIKDYLMID